MFYFGQRINIYSVPRYEINQFFVTLFVFSATRTPDRKENCSWCGRPTSPADIGREVRDSLVVLPLASEGEAKVGSGWVSRPDTALSFFCHELQLGRGTEQEAVEINCCS